MKTTAVRMHGAMDIRLESFKLPPVGKDEVLMEVVTDSLCASTFKAVRQGTAHKRVPPDIAENPVIIGHEMCSIIREVGENLRDVWKAGQKAVIQPALKLESGYDPGYSYKYVGGSATYVVVPSVVIERGCLVPYNGEGFFKGSLVEALGCILRGFKGCYHTDFETYIREDGVKKGGKVAILGGAGPMGIGAVEIALGYAAVSQIVVTDINAERLAFAQRNCPPERAAEKGCELLYCNTSGWEDAASRLIGLSGGGFDDVFVMVPSPELFSMAEKICRTDGCVNFFAGPAAHEMQGSLNLYRIHYDGIHVVGTAGSIPQDTVETIGLIEDDRIDPAALVSHILGLSAAVDAVLAMEKPSGAKKVCYTGLDLPYIAIDELAEYGKTDPMYAELASIVKRHNGLWCAEAEEYLLRHAPKIGEIQ